MIISINPDFPQGRQLDKVARILRDGGLIAYPTDTQYGIGCDLRKRKSIERLYRLKRRSAKRPFSLICSDLKDISRYARVSDYAYRTMRRILPGPFTVVLPGTKLVPQIMLSRRSECGIRVPGHNIPLRIVETLESPIINTSATLPLPEGADADADGEVQQPVAIDPGEIEAAFKGLLDAVVDGGPVPGAFSTVLSLVDDDPVIIRQGLGKF
ncbi:MAG: threonylcarbamoyl-AMP synthase [Deltaproteobacteria bacterium]|jgi:tRNA threonylcarbamoyl adenosine modification protein (Sua5/YciO/YrdC/YwlC family)|nr:threonylcarbamoyl-AMP synthase [Deltaproteobacteria bacterium]